MRTRFVGKLMSILSFSLQGDTAERITAWEREIATYERDSSKVLDDEIKIGTFLLRLPESQLKTHLLMRVDTLKKWTDFRSEVVAISSAVSAAQAQPTAMDIGAVGKGQSGKNGKGTRGVKNATIKRSMRVRDVETRSTRPQIVPTLIKRAENVERSVIWQVRADQLDRNNPSQRITASRARVGKVRVLRKRGWNCGESGHLSSQCPEKQVHAVDESAATVSVAGSRETVMVGPFRKLLRLGERE